MRRRLFSIICAVCLAIALTPVLAFATDGESPEGATHAAHPVCGTTCGHDVNASQDGVQSHEAISEWIAIDDASDFAYLQAGKNYYLANDVMLTSTGYVDVSITLCLNGKVLALTNGVTDNVVTVNSGAALNLTDCASETHKFSVGNDGLWALNDNGDKSVSGGVITGGNAKASGRAYPGGVYVSGALNMYGGNIVGNKVTGRNPSGGGIYVHGGAVCNMYGGSVSGNIAASGGGVYVYGSFNMYGGIVSNNTAFDNSATGVGKGNGGGVNVGKELYTGSFNLAGGAISDNTAAANGGGVFVNSNFAMSGNPVISDNAKLGGVDSNIYLNAGKTIAVEGLSGGNQYGVSSSLTTGEIYITGDNASGARTSFLSEMPNYSIGVTADTGVIVLEKQSASTYSYAYDAYRDPAFPSAVGSAITANNFDEPLKRDSSVERYASSSGTWTLTELGYYGDVKASLNPAPTSYLDGVMSTVATSYGVGADTLVVHKLTDTSGVLVCYGVVVAVDETNGYALFVGDLWGSSGAGYLLSKNGIGSASSVTFNAQEMAQSKYSIALSTDAVIFDNAQVGYGVPDAKEIMVVNTGDGETGALIATLSGGGNSKFTLVGGTVTGIANKNGTASFTVAPKSELAAGTYVETITVKGDKVMPATVTVSFTVEEDPNATYTVTYTDGVDSKEVFADQITSGVASGAATPTFNGTPSRAGYSFAGWNPEVAETVTSDVTYTATWIPVYIPVVPEPEPVCPDEAACNCFDDVDEDAWYHETIDWAVENGLIRGYDDGSNNVGPDDDATRAQIVTILWRAMDEPGTTGKGAWYGDAFAWALDMGVIKGYNDDPTKLGANDEITREQLAAILWRFAQANGVDVSVGEDTNILSFTDADEISEWAIPAMQWAVGSGVIAGYTDANGEPTGELGPTDTATRAEAMATIERLSAFCNLV